MRRLRQNFNRDNLQDRRRGAVMIAAAICLLLATALLASALKLAISGRKQVHRERFRTQAVWLAEAGLERAAAKLQEAVSYEGETWNIPAADLDGRHTGQVVIKVNVAEEAKDNRIVIVEATFPADAIELAKLTRRTEMPAGSE